MARTTGYTCTAAVRLAGPGGCTRRTGISPPEFLGREPGCYDFVMARAGAAGRGVRREHGAAGVGNRAAAGSYNPRQALAGSASTARRALRRREEEGAWTARSAVSRSWSPSERGIELDVCPWCHGLWFDAGELALLAEKLGRTLGVAEGARSRRRPPRRSRGAARAATGRWRRSSLGSIAEGAAGPLRGARVVVRPRGAWGAGRAS